VDGQILLAIIPPRSEQLEVSSAQWEYTISALLGQQLAESKQIRVAPVSSIDFAYRDLGLTREGALDTTQALRLAARIEVSHIIWGEYSRRRGQWSLATHLLKVSDEKSPKNLTTTAPEWIDVICAVRNHVLRELGVTPSSHDLARMNTAPTRSAEALELLSRAYSETKNKVEIPQSIAYLRRALAVDSNFSLASRSLADFLVAQGKSEEALGPAKRAVVDAPDSGGAHSTLGMVYFSLNLNALAQEQLQEAIRLEPDEPDHYQRMGAVYLQKGKFPEAAETLRKAVALAPFDSLGHGLLALTLIKLGEREKSLRELEIAETCDTGGNAAVSGTLGQAYELLNDLPKAVNHFEALLSRTKEQHAEGESLIEASTHLKELKDRLIPHSVGAVIPPALSSDQLTNRLRAILSPSEFALVVNPLSCSCQMADWAQKEVHDSVDPLERAKKLFTTLIERVKWDDNNRRLTATEAFENWRTTNACMSCQDYAFLFVALTRSVGVNSWYVEVQKDYSGKPVSHACAMVAAGDTVLLVDPVYKWFGVPHDKYDIRDDVHAVAAYLAGSHDTDTEEVGLKLAPNWATLHFSVALSRIYRSRCEDAKGPLEHGLRLDPDGWFALYTQGVWEMCEGRTQSAIDHLRKCLTLNPDWSLAHFSLGTMLGRQGDLKAAGEELRAYLQGRTNPGLAAQASEALAYIHRKLEVPLVGASVSP
jgi:tetratricopeptide (TPR) repeat protein